MEKIGFLGADVSKGHCDFVFINSEGKELSSVFQLDDTRQGHDGLLQRIAAAREEFDFAKVAVAVESTGGYENNWFNTLQRCNAGAGIDVFRINPIRTFYESRSEGRKSIDDGVSARVIASHIRKNYGLYTSKRQEVEQNSELRKHLRSLNNCIAAHTKQEVRLKNTLEKILYSSIPELLAFKGEKYSNWFLELLLQFPGKVQIIKAGVEGLSSIRHLSVSKATKIIEALDKSVGSEDSVTSEIIEDLASEIKHLQMKNKKLSKKLFTYGMRIYASKLEIVTSIRGIADDTAIKLLLEIGPVHRFNSASKLVAFFGLNPVFKSSGDYVGKAKMSKAGSSTARAILFMAAKNVVLHEPFFKAIYARHRALGKSHMSAIVIVMSKLTRVIYGMLKSNQAFDAGIDKFNQEKKPSTTVKTERPTIETKQYTSLDAPVSYRERRRRSKALQNAKNPLQPAQPQINHC